MDVLEDPVAFLRVSNKVARLEESKAFESKKWIWIADKKECFKAAEVKSSKGDVYVVETNDGQVKKNNFRIGLVLCTTMDIRTFIDVKNATLSPASFTYT